MPGAPPQEDASPLRFTPNALCRISRSHQVRLPNKVLEGAPPLPFKGGLLRSNAAKFPLPSSLRTSALSARPERIRRRPLSVISNSLYFFVPSTHDFFAFPAAASATAASEASTRKVT